MTTQIKVGQSWVDKKGDIGELITELKPGSVVRLKSGGPRMTVINVREDGKWQVAWFSEWGEQQLMSSTHLPLESLELVTEDSDAPSTPIPTGSVG